MSIFKDVKEVCRQDSNLHGYETMAERASEVLGRPMRVSELHRWIDEYPIIHVWKTELRVNGAQIHTHTDSLDYGVLKVCEKIKENNKESKKRSMANLWRGSTWTIQTG